MKKLLNLKVKLGFRQLDMIMTKEESIVTIIRTALSGEKYCNNIMFRLFY